MVITIIITGSQVCFAILLLCNGAGWQWAADAGADPPLRGASRQVFWQCEFKQLTYNLKFKSKYNATKQWFLTLLSWTIWQLLSMVNHHNQPQDDTPYYIIKLCESQLIGLVCVPSQWPLLAGTGYKWSIDIKLAWTKVIVAY